MSDLIVKIGDDALDLNVDEVIAITKQAAKVGDFSAVLADGTNEVKVPLTPNNRTIMDNAHLIPSDSAKPYQRLDATVIQEGYETIQDGYAIVKSSDNDFSLQVVGGNASFFNRVKDLNIRDLDLSDYTHFWTNQEAFDRRNETEGLIYALIEQSNGDNTLHTYGTNLYAVETRLLLPMYYLKTYVEKIFSEQGYTFVTDLIGEDIYEKAAIFRGKIPDRGSDMTYHECTVRCDSDQLAEPVFSPEGFILFQDASIDTTTSVYASSPELEASVQNGFDARFLMTDSCTLTLNLSLIIQNDFGAVNAYIEITHTSASGIITTNTNVVSIANGTTTNNFTATFDCSEYEGEIYFATKIKYVVSSLQPITVKANSTYTVSDVVLISNSIIQTSFPFNYLTGVTTALDMKQGDFLKEIAKVYQWVYDTDERTHTVTAKRFGEIKDNIPLALDFSDKVDARRKSITYGVDGFAQTNALRYKEDDITLYDAVGYINVDDTTLKAEIDYVKMSQLAASSTRLRFDTVNAPYVPIFEEDLPTNGLADRVFLLNRVTFPYNINFARVGETPANHPTDDVTFAYFTEAGNTDSLDFPNLINRFYQPIVDMNFRAKSVEFDVNLKIKDVVNYDPFIPVYIESEGNYFYWEKLGNYVKDKLTKCKFIRI